MSGPQQQGPGEQVGSLAEEAMKLLGALTDAVHHQAPADEHEQEHEAGPGLGGLGAGLLGLAGRAARWAEEVDEHVATGAPECAWCPLCRTVHAVRRTSPEVRAHLASAGTSLLQALAGALATPVPDPGAERGSKVERIDLDGDEATADWPEEDR